jgi:heme exporter protein A
LLDEPLVGLDAAGQMQLGTWIAQHLSVGGIALLSSHQLVPESIPGLSILQLEPA